MTRFSPSRKSLALVRLLVGIAAAAAVHPRFAAGNFQALGCFHEPPRHEGGRALRGPHTDSDQMTALACSQFCAGYKYFGTEWSRECYCDNSIAPNTVEADGACLNIYTNGAYVQPYITPVTAYTYQGREEHGEHRYLPDATFKQANMSPQVCAGLCSGFLYFGVEFGDECWCGNTLHGGKWVGNAQCKDKLCAGDTASYCGGCKRLLVYGPASIDVARVDGADYFGCVKDTPSSRVLSGYSVVWVDMTPALCASTCGEYAYFGIEFGKECYCGNALQTGYASADDSECDEPCYGARDRLTVYKVTAVASNPPTVGGFTFLECGVDSVSNRVLRGAYKSEDGRLTAGLCASDCEGYAYFGLEFGKECFCGNEYTGTTAEAGDCAMRCAGDNNHQLCGGRDRISVYAAGGNGPIRI